MDIFEIYKENFTTLNSIENDYRLVEFKDGILLGQDRDGNISVVIRSSIACKTPFRQRTKLLSLECNIKVRYYLNGKIVDDIVHIFKCYSKVQKEERIFLELVSLLIMETDNSEENIFNVFRTLINFFSDRNELSDNELIGLYAELFTIKSFHDSLHIEKFWQSRDRMKFDFSFSEKVKLEVKSTTKNTRTHHFRHEQLMSDMYDIYVLSYLFRYDDAGLSLLDLITECKKYFDSDAKKLLRLNYVIKNVDEERLKNLKFNQEYTNTNRHFYKAKDIPRFNEYTPEGVANAEYDCVLDNIESLTDNEFCKLIEEEVNS